jgi:hypothetical protein
MTKSAIEYAKTKRPGNLIIAGVLACVVLVLAVSAYWLR